MSEDEVQYTSVVLKSARLPRAKNQEEVVYAEVKKPNQTAQQTSDTNGFLSDKATETRCIRYQKLACCFGSLCMILVLAIIGLTVCFVFSEKSEEKELKQLRVNQTLLLEENINLTNLNDKLSVDLKVHVYNLTRCNTQSSALEVETENLTAEVCQVKEKNQELQKEKKSLAEKIKTMERTILSLTQPSVGEFCLTGNNDRKCGSCEKGWLYCRLSCYAFNNAEPAHQKTWEEAQEDCKGKDSKLTVVGSDKEKMYVNSNSWHQKIINGYWIGLRAVEGKWKWIDGSDLTNQTWIQHKPAVDGQCVTSLQNREWRSVSCNEKNAWICKKTAV